MTGRWCKPLWYVALVAVSVFVSRLPAQAVGKPAGSPTPEQRRTLEQVALGRARTQAYERVRELPLTQNLAIAAWLALDVDTDRALRLWVRTRPMHGQPRHYSDRVCEVDVCIDPADLQAELLRLLTDHQRGTASQPVRSPAGVNEDRLKTAARGWPIVWATGAAAPSKLLRSMQPPAAAGWEDVSAEGLALARGAAAADARQALLAEAAKLKVGAARHLREFLESSPQVGQAVQSELERAAKVKVELAGDQVAVAEARISVRELLRLLTRIHQQYYQGQEFAAADFRQMVLLAGQEELVATGLATPPSHTMLQARYAPIEYNAPDWAQTTLSAVGRCEPVEGEFPDMATRTEAARLDGVDRLQQQVMRLVVQKDVTVADFLGYYQDLKPDVVLLLSGTRVVAPAASLPDGSLEVKVELPLRRLWEILRRNMKLEEVEPPAGERPTDD